MAIDPENMKRLEDSLVHEEEEPMPEGWGIYATPKYLSRVVLAVYAVMLVGMGVTQLAYWGGKVPRLLAPESLLVILPIAVVALYLNFVSPPERELEKKRTMPGRLITFVLALVLVQIATLLLWIGIIRSFSLQ